MFFLTFWQFENFDSKQNFLIYEDISDFFSIFRGFVVEVSRPFFEMTLICPYL